jgi:hypothetical protein
VLWPLAVSHLDWPLDNARPDALLVLRSCLKKCKKYNKQHGRGYYGDDDEYYYKVPWCNSQHHMS